MQQFIQQSRRENSRKQDIASSIAKSWIRTKISFSLLRTTNLCIRGSRTKLGEIEQLRDTNIRLATTNSGIDGPMWRMVMWRVGENVYLISKYVTRDVRIAKIYGHLEYAYLLSNISSFLISRWNDFLPFSVSHSDWKNYDTIRFLDIFRVTRWLENYDTMRFLNIFPWVSRGDWEKLVY